jgi:hypothetical protein
MAVLTRNGPSGEAAGAAIGRERALVLRGVLSAHGSGFRWQGLVYFLCALWLGRATELQAQDPRSSTALEYKVKAAYLFNFVKYVEWPAGAFSSPNAPYCIGVLGEDPFGEVLDKTVADRTVNDRAVTIQRSKRSEDLKNCHVVFISVSEKKQLGDILASYKSAPILTVGETERFIQAGGMITFAIEKESVRFDVEWDKAEEISLKISARMLASARTVYSRKRSLHKP